MTVAAIDARICTVLRRCRDAEWETVHQQLADARRCPHFRDVCRDRARVHLHLALSHAAQLRRLEARRPDLRKAA